MANQDLTTWTETDASGMLSVTSSTLTFTALSAVSTSVENILLDNGASAFPGDFKFRVGPVNFSAASSTNSVFNILTVGAAVQATGAGERYGVPSLCLWWQNTATNPTLTFQQFQSGDATPDVTDTYQGANVALSTNFYVEIERSGSTATAKLYSDAYSTLVDTLTLSLASTDTYRYTFAGRIMSGSGATVTGTLQNIDLDVAAATTTTKLKLLAHSRRRNAA